MNIYDCLYAAMMLSGYDRSQARVEASYLIKRETYYTVVRKDSNKKDN